MGEVINVGFIGNPNCGKTTLFNAYTGANLKLAGCDSGKKRGHDRIRGRSFQADRSPRYLQSDLLHNGRDCFQRVYYE